MIDKFTREQFEKELPINTWNGAPMWEYYGNIAGEHEYIIRIMDGVRIHIRSSVNGLTNLSADTGEDSIRCWLERVDESQRVKGGIKISKYTTRTLGWSKRLTLILRQLYKVGLSLKVCPRDSSHGLMGGYKVKFGKPENRGRMFQKCGECGHLEWMEVK